MIKGSRVRELVESRLATADPHHLRDHLDEGVGYTSMLNSGFQHVRTDTDEEGETTHHYTHPSSENHTFQVHSDRPGISVTHSGGATVGRHSSISGALNYIKRSSR